MIRTNLATRPFYNDRAVQIWLAVAAVLVVAATVFNVSRVLHYSRNETELALRASHDEADAAALRGKAAQERASVDVKQITADSARAREANDLIDRRTFSWTELFNRFEATLPADVRITSVRPRLDEKDRRMQLLVSVLARRYEDIDQFVENLEGTGAFDRLLPTDTHATESGDWESTVTMTYGGAKPAAGGRP